MNKRLQALLRRKAAAVEKMKAVRAAAGEALFTAEQTAEFDAAKAEAGTLEAAIAQEREAIEIERTAAALPAQAGGTALDVGDATVQVGVDRRTLDAQHGFAHFGQFLSAVRGAALRPTAVDERLRIGAAASTYANESSGADGGFLVPPQYSNEIMSVIDAGESLMTRVRQIPVSGNSFIFPANEETAHGTNGVQAYWDSEADTISQTKPVFKNGEIKLCRLTALCPVTEESLEDAPALGTWISMLAGDKMAYKLSYAILNGTGVGTMLGLLNSPALVTVAKETSQAAGTVLAANVLKMYSRMPARNRMSAVWIINQDVEALLPQMTVNVKNVAGTENVGGGPLFLPPGGLSGSQYGTLLGRPIVMTEASPALSSAGDIVLADMRQYMAITKGAVKADQSMHFYFDQNIRAFRFVMRVGGQPWLSAPIARASGSNTLSHFVALGAR
jgi:HK97 family phage major capsid protein